MLCWPGNTSLCCLDQAPQLLLACGTTQGGVVLASPTAESWDRHRVGHCEDHRISSSTSTMCGALNTPLQWDTWRGYWAPASNRGYGGYCTLVTTPGGGVGSNDREESEDHHCARHQERNSLRLGVSHPGKQFCQAPVGPRSPHMEETARSPLAVGVGVSAQRGRSWPP